MLKLTLLAVVAVATVLAAPKPADENYKSRLDSINVNEVIANGRLFDAFINCFLEKENAKCTPLAKSLKEQLIALLPEMLETNCAKCTKEQWNKLRQILLHLHDEKREIFDQLLDKYDHDNAMRKKYKEKYAELAKKEGLAHIFD